ncbi:hypothetical protein D3C75_1270340 [compost metagenome]
MLLGMQDWHRIVVEVPREPRIVLLPFFLFLDPLVPLRSLHEYTISACLPALQSAAN